MNNPVDKKQERYCFIEKMSYLCTRIRQIGLDALVDSLAQQVEHIPFKDGVLGSNPRWITKVQKDKLGKIEKSF